MELLLVLVGLALLGFPVWVFIKIQNLNDDVSQLKYELRSLSSGAARAGAQESSYNEPNLVSFAPSSVPLANQRPFGLSQIPVNYEHKPNAFFVWLTEDILMKLGALLLLMGFGWFVSYAFINNWIGPVGRISLGLLAGAAIMALGTWRIKDYRHQGSIFLILGSGTVLLTLFAARELYEFLTPSISLLVMFMSVAYVAFVSVIYQSEKLALAGLIMAAVAPLLTNTPDPSIMGLMAYLFVVVIGTLWVVRLTGSHLLTLAAVVMMLVYSLPIIAEVAASQETLVLLFAFAFAMIFFITNTLSIIQAKAEAALRAQIFTALGTGAFLTLWIVTVMSEHLQSLAFVSWMVIFSIGTFLVYEKTTNRIPFFIYGAVTVGFLFAATAAELSGEVLTLAFTVEVAAIILIAQRLFAPKIAEKLVYLLALPIVLSLESIDSRAWNDSILHADFVALVTIGGALGAIGITFLFAEVVTDTARRIAKVLLGLSLGYLLMLIWLVLHAILPADVATTSALIIYTVLGLGIFFYGQIHNTRTLQIVGGVILGGVVTRLLLIDVWQMDLVGRIITFFAVGTLLISTAFVGKKKKREADGLADTSINE